MRHFAVGYVLCFIVIYVYSSRSEEAHVPILVVSNCILRIELCSGDFCAILKITELTV